VGDNREKLNEECSNEELMKNIKSRRGRPKGSKNQHKVCSKTSKSS
jgi:hypothetical protein